MGCCGQRRSQFRNASPPSGSRATAPLAMSGIERASARPAFGPGVSGAAGGSAEMVRYLGRTRVVVRGPVTGRRYEFPANGPGQTVDARDARVLLSMRYFIRSG